jgi:lambda repressor-like predicted transcriptional regulator
MLAGLKNRGKSVKNMAQNSPISYSTKKGAVTALCFVQNRRSLKVQVIQVCLATGEGLKKFDTDG